MLVKVAGCMGAKEGIIVTAATVSLHVPRYLCPSRIIVDSEMVQAIKFSLSLRKVCGLRGDPLSVSFVSDTVPMSEEKKFTLCHA